MILLSCLHRNYRWGEGLKCLTSGNKRSDSQLGYVLSGIRFSVWNRLNFISGISLFTSAGSHLSWRLLWSKDTFESQNQYKIKDIPSSRWTSVMFAFLFNVSSRRHNYYVSTGFPLSLEVQSGKLANVQLSILEYIFFLLDMEAHWARRFHVKEKDNFNWNSHCMTYNNARDRAGDSPAKRQVVFQNERDQHRNSGGHDFPTQLLCRTTVLASAFGNRKPQDVCKG